MLFQIRGLDPEPFRPLYGLSDADLAARGALRRVVDAAPGFPDRITLEDVPVGRTVLLLNHTHQPARTPYRASHPIFIQEGATRAYRADDVVPDMIARRLVSLRAFSRDGMMVDAQVCQGAALVDAIATFWRLPEAAYLHVHFAERGCFAARIDRP